jgi:uncharacterized membrane protein
VRCPKCGALVRIPGPIARDRKYRCSRCKAEFTASAKPAGARAYLDRVGEVISKGDFPSPRFKKVVIALFVFLFLFSTASLLINHFIFHTSAYDTGIEAGVARNIVFHGSFYDTVRNMNRLGDHFDPALAIPGVLFKIWDNAGVVFIFQNICAFASVILAYFLAKRILKNQLKALMLTLIYALNVYLGVANRFEFHIEFLSLPLTLLLLLVIEGNGRRLTNLAMIVPVSLLLLLVKEDWPLILAGLGLWVLLFKKSKRIEGLAMFAIGTAGFLTIMLYAMPHFSAGQYQYVARYSNLGSSPSQIVKTIFTNPKTVLVNLVTPFSKKATSVLSIWGSFLFLPVLAPVCLLAGFVGFFYNIISNYPPQYSFSYQYSIPVLAFLFYASIYGFKRLEAVSAKWLANLRSPFNVAYGYIIVGIIVFALIFLFEYSITFEYSSDLALNSALAHDIKPNLPKDARLMANLELQPHFIEYKYAGAFNYTVKLNDLEQVDYVVIFIDRIPYSWDEASYNDFISTLKQKYTEVCEDKHFLLIAVK